MDPISTLSEKDREIYKKVARFVYSQGVVTIEEVEQKCNLLSFEAWRVVNVLNAVGVLSMRDAVMRVWGSVPTGQTFDEMVDDALSDVDGTIRAAAEAAVAHDVRACRKTRELWVRVMMDRFPAWAHEALVEIAEMILCGRPVQEILIACDKSGLNETECWLREMFSPVPPSDKGFVS
jgi:hypothetical protein